MRNPNEEEFNQRIQGVARGLENLVERINLTRQILRSRAQLARELVAKPVVDKWQGSRPLPIGLEILGRISPQPERAEAKQVEIKQAEPKPAEPKPILLGLWNLITTKPKVEVPPAEAEPAKPESEPLRWSRYKSPDAPALL